jgi:hypothetical protein
MTVRLAAPLAVPLAVALAVALLLSAGGRAAAGREVGDPVLVGAGDIADCNSTHDEETANLLEGIDGTVATLGDNAYESGTTAEYRKCYGPSWGRESIKRRTMPSLGNHEYYTADASGYFDYFSGLSATPSAPVPNTRDNPGLTPGKGYYSYDLGSWHVVVLNSNCEEVGCEADSDQVKWLEADLAANSDKECTLAYFHDPRFSSSGFGDDGIDDSAVESFWEALYDADAEVVLNGHRHNYERFAPQTPDGVADSAKGIREFVVGTGGEKLMAFKSTADNSEAGDENTYGVLKLTLHPTGYDWKFVPVAGESFTDSGSDSCHGAPSHSSADTKAPRVTSTVPADTTTGVSPTANVTATFSEDMEASSIKDTTFKLKERGSTTQIPAKVTYDASTHTATLDPTDSLLSGRTYKAVVTPRVKDLAGNRLDQDGATTGLQQKTWLFKVGN